MKAIGYFRVASDASPDGTYTLKEQEKIFSLFCSESGYEPATAFVDMDSGLRVSGTQYQSMLSYIWENGGDFTVVLKSLQHLHSDPYELLKCLIELDVVGAKIHFIDATAADPLEVALLSWAAQRHSDKSGEVVKEAMKARAVRGKGLGKPPFGYKIGSNQKFELVPAEAETVSLIYRLYLQEKKGVRLIARHLNERGITTRRGGRWSIVGVRDILRNRSYVGTYERFGLRVPGSHPAIIQFAVFEKVQETLTAKASHREHVVKIPFLVSGIVYCGHCGNKMTGMNRSQSWTNKKSGIKRTGAYRYYQCQSKTNQSFCEYNTRKADDLEIEVVAELRRLNQPGEREKLIKQPSNPSVAQVQQPQLRKMQKYLERKFRGYLDDAAKGTITIEQLRELGGDAVRERRLVEQRLNLIWAEARGEITAEQRREYTFNDLDKLLKQFDSLNLAAKRSLMRYVVDRVIVHDKHIETVLWL